MYILMYMCMYSSTVPTRSLMHICVHARVCSVEFVPRYIKTSGNATVDHLSKYLAVRLALEELRRNAEASPVNVEAASEKQYTIYIPTAGNQFTVSTHTHTVIIDTPKTALTAALTSCDFSTLTPLLCVSNLYVQTSVSPHHCLTSLGCKVLYKCVELT